MIYVITYRQIKCMSILISISMYMISIYILHPHGPYPPFGVDSTVQQEAVLQQAFEKAANEVSCV